VLYQLYFDDNGLSKPADDDGKIDKVISQTVISYKNTPQSTAIIILKQEMYDGE
jgi:hypothetical protein